MFRPMFVVLLLLLCVCSSVCSLPTVYIAGDSTVQTFPSRYYPWQGWGSHLHDYISPNITISNHAMAGRSSKSFVTEGRLTSILNVIKPGDYLFVQFGTNDASNQPERHTDPQTTYKSYLRNFTIGARLKGATCVLVTPPARRSLNLDGTFKDDFPTYVNAMKQLSIEQHTTLIDLNTRSIQYFNKIGYDATKKIFMILDVGQYRNYPNGYNDNTHYQDYGASQIARLVAQGILDSNLPLKTYVMRGPVIRQLDSTIAEIELGIDDNAPATTTTTRDITIGVAIGGSVIILLIIIGVAIMYNRQHKHQRQIHVLTKLDTTNTDGELVINPVTPPIQTTQP